VPITIDSAPNGLLAVDGINVSVDNASVASIENANNQTAVENGLSASSDFPPDQVGVNSVSQTSVNFSVSDLAAGDQVATGDTDIVLGVVNLTNLNNGSATVNVDVRRALDDSRTEVTNFTANSAAMSVQPTSAAFEVSNLNAVSRITAGDSYTVSATITNTGTAAGATSATYTLSNGTATPITEGQTTPTLQPNESTTVTFNVAGGDTSGLNTSSAYTHTVTAGGDSATAPLAVAGADGFIQGTVRDTNNNPIQNANIRVTAPGFNETFIDATDTNGDYTVRVPGLGANSPYQVEIIQPGFQSFDTQGVTVGPSETSRIDVTLVPIVTASDIEVNPASASAFAGESVTFTATVFNSTTEPRVALEGRQVQVSSSNPDVTVTPIQNTTGPNGTATFTATAGVVASSELNFTVTDGDQPFQVVDVSFIRNGEGFIQGTVTNDATTDPVQNASAYAILADRFSQNTFTNTLPVPDDTVFVRLVDNQTGQIIDNDDYRVQVVNASNTSVRKVDELNTTNEAVGEGFALIDANGDSNVTFQHTRLAPEEYYAEISVDAGNSSQDALDDDTPENFSIRAPATGTFAPTTNLTLAAAEQRARDSDSNLVDSPGFVNSFGEDTAGTNEFGNFKLNKLFTDFQSGREYVVVAERPGFSRDYADVEAFENGAPSEQQFFYQFDLLPEDIEPAAIDIQQVGTTDSVAGNIVEFGNQTDEFAQNVSRDGTIDVFDVTTTDGAGEVINGTAIVEIEDNDTSATRNFDGDFVAAEGGQILASSEDQVRVTTGEDGVVRLYLRSDNQSSDLLTQKTATLANDLSKSDSSNVRFVGVTAFQSASISGIVSDSDDTPIPDSAVWAQQFDFGIDADPIRDGVQERNRFTIEPQTSADTGTQAYAEAVDSDDDEFVVSRQRGVFNNSSGEFTYVTVGTDVATAAELRNYDFQEFASVSIEGDTGFKLYDRAADNEDASYTLDPVPAVAQGDLETNYRIVAVKFGAQPAEFQGVVANPGRASILPATTDDANVVFSTDIPDLASSDLDISGLSAPSQASQNDTITVTATVTNDGNVVSESQTVSFRLDTNANGQLDDTEEILTQQVGTLGVGQSTQVTFDVPLSAIETGTYTHGVVAENQPGDADDSVVTAQIEVTNGPNPPTQAKDPGGDGLFEDVNGDGLVNFLDVVTLFENLENPNYTADQFDFNNNGQFEFLDVVTLLDQV
jgi:hypothetical protein